MEVAFSALIYVNAKNLQVGNNFVVTMFLQSYFCIVGTGVS